MDYIALGLRIKQCRKRQHLTQERLAELANVSPHYIYEIEKGLKHISLSTLGTICSSLNTSADYLLFGAQNHSKSDSFDILDQLITPLSPQKRESVAHILQEIIPHLK